MSFKKISEKLRVNNNELTLRLTEVKRHKNGSKTTVPKKGAGDVRNLIDFLARNYLQHNSNCLKIKKKTLREQLYISNHNLEKWINLSIDYNVLKIKKISGLNELTLMLNPSIYQYGYIDDIEGIKDTFWKIESAEPKRKREKSLKEIQRIAKNLKNAKKIRKEENNVISVNFGN